MELENRYTGLCTQFHRVEPRPHDPDIAIAAAESPAWNPGDAYFGGSGASWTQENADLACFGEVIERVLARPLATDKSITSSWADWQHSEPAIDPARWILFHPEQYALPSFPFAPLDPEATCRWTCCRAAASGEPVWVPEELVYLTPRSGESQRFTFGFSTGLTCGRRDHPVVLRGAQEVIERDALVGGWWGTYALEEWPSEIVRELLASEICERVERPNLTYRFYRIRTPYSAHVTMVSLAGLDHEGWVFSVGSACRETRAASWKKSLLEAIQGRHCVRRLLGEHVDDAASPKTPTTFFEHALHYTLHRDLLGQTVLERAVAARHDEDGVVEGLPRLQTRLGNERPILFRHLTPPFLLTGHDDWFVARVLVPGLQPLHGDHRLPFLGGPMWGSRPISDWNTMPPHPFA